MRKQILATFIFGLLGTPMAHSQSQKPPEIYVDENFCPGEGCQFGEWKVIKEISVYDQPNGQRIVGKLQPGKLIRALTGNVYVKPVPVVVLYPKNDFRKGETFYLLSNVGEGIVKTWRSGKIGEVDYEGISGLWDHNCTNVSAKCWARTEAREISQVWWVKIESSDLKGWIKDPSANVEGSDRFE